MISSQLKNLINGRRTTLDNGINSFKPNSSLESFLEQKRIIGRCRNADYLRKLDLSGLWPPIVVTPDLSDMKKDIENIASTIDQARCFNSYLDQLIRSGKNLDLGYMDVPVEQLRVLKYGMMPWNVDWTRYVCEDLHKCVDLVYHYWKPIRFPEYVRGNLDFLTQQIKYMRAIYIALEREDFQSILDLIPEDTILNQLIIMTMILHRMSDTEPRHVRRTYYALIKLVGRMNPTYLDYFNLDLITNVHLLVPFRRYLLAYTLQKGYLFTGFPTAIDPYYKPVNKRVMRDLSRFVDPCNIESLFNSATEQAADVTSQSRSDIEHLVHLWDSLPQDLTVEEMVDLARGNNAREQGLFSVDIGLDESTREFFIENLNKLGRGMSNLYHQTFTQIDRMMESGFENMQKLIAYLLGAILVGVATYYKIKLISKLFSFFISFLFGNGSESISFAKEQSFEEDASWNGPLLLFLSVFGVSAGALSSSKCMNLIRLVSALPRAEQGLESLFKWVKQTYDSCYRIFSRYFLGVDPGISVFADNHPVAKWLDELKEPYERFSKGIFGFDAASFSIVHSLFIRGLELQRSISFRSDWGAIRTGMDCLNRILSEFRTRNIVAGSVRNPPVVIHLFGGTGVGKSTLTNILAASVINKIQPGVDLKKQWKNLIYSRAQEQEFWDGYTGQLVTVFDDFCQTVDSAAKPNLELFDIVRAANVYPYPLHMANLGEKGCTNFTSKLIVCSSNLKKPKTESLNFPSALYRRFDICIEVRRNPKYAGQELNHYCHDFYEFLQYDMTTGKTISGITWDNLVAKCVEIYHKRSEFVDSLDKTINEVLSAPLFTKQEEVQKRLDGYLPVPIDDVNEASEQINCAKLGFCDCEIWGEEPCLMFQDERSWYDKLKRKIRFYLWEKKESLEHAFDTLKSLAEDYKQANMPRYVAWYEDLKKRYPFLENGKLIALVVGLIVTGPLVFFGISKLFDRQDSVAILKPENHPEYKELYGDPPEWQHLEGYNSSSSKMTKNEAYNDPNVKATKHEGYNPSQPKTVKVEMSFPDGRVSGTEMNLASAQLHGYMKAITEQGVADKNAAEICSKVVTRNLFKIFIQDNDLNHIPLGHVLFVKGKIGLMPYHYVAAMRQVLRTNPRADVFFRSIFLDRAFLVKLEDLVRTVVSVGSPDLENNMILETRDLCSFHIENGWNFPDISGLFVSKYDLSFLATSKVLLPTLAVAPGGSTYAAVKIGKAVSGIQREDCNVRDAKGGSPRLIRHCWKYCLETETGDCGSPLIARNPLLPGRKIMGMHVAGNPDFGFSTPLYKEDIDLIINKYKKEFSICSEQCHPVHMPKGCHLPESSSFVVVEKLERPLFASSETVIRPSILNGILSEVKTKPCQLRDTKEFSPMKYRLGKFASAEVPIPSNLISNACEAVSQHVIRAIIEKKDLITTADKSVYTFEEAVAGLPEEDFVNAIKRKSSPGYPFVVDSQWNTKEKIFGPGPDFCMDSEQAVLLKQRVESIIADAKEGVRQRHVFVDTLKDERKPIHKAHKTRMFSACPLDYLIACKMYFGGVVSVIQKARNDTGISVGTNVYSYDWTVIAHTLLQKSNKMIAGDFEGFDSSQMQSVLRAAGKVLKNIAKEVLGASEEDLLVMSVLLESLLSSFHLNKDCLYAWFKGLPSGHFLTAVINSIFVLLSFCMAWQLAFGVSLRQAFLFFEVCGIVAYGDDHIVSVPEWATQEFNQFTLIELMKKIGLSYTLEDKDAVVEQPHRCLSEVSFLKRKFYWDEELRRYLAPLDVNSILETPMWVKKCPDMESQTLVELENSLRELSLHPPETWNAHIESFKKCSKLLGSFSPFLNREFAKDFVLNGSA